MKRIIIPASFQEIAQDFLEADKSVTLFAVHVDPVRQLVFFHITHDEYPEVPVAGEPTFSAIDVSPKRNNNETRDNTPG